MANSGPKGRGVKRGSQVPHSTACGLGYSVTKRTQEGGLAHSCFTADHDHGAPPTASHRGQRLLEHGQLARSLEQLVRPARYGGHDSQLGACPMVHPDGLRFNGGQHLPATGQELPHDGEIAVHPVKMAPESRGSPKTTGPKNGQPRSPIWVAHAHAGQLRRL